MSEVGEAVVVAGGGGFIGRALLEKLARHYPVVSLDRSEPEGLPAEFHWI